MTHRPSATAVATFPDRPAADAALGALHDAGYRRTWLGVTTSAGAVEPAAPPLARWLHHETARTLCDVLRDHGVLEDDARAIDGSVVAGECVVVVEDVDDPANVAELLHAKGGVPRTVAAVREELFVRR